MEGSPFYKVFVDLCCPAFPARVLCSETFYLDRLVGDPAAHIQNKSREGKERDQPRDYESTPGLNEGKSRSRATDVWWAPLLPCLQVFNLFQTPVSPLNSPCSLWVSSVTPHYFLSTGTGSRASKKGCALSSHSPPFMGQKPPHTLFFHLLPLLSRPFLLPLFFFFFSLWSLLRYAATVFPQVIISFVGHTHAQVRMCSLGRLSVLHQQWSGRARMHSASQQTALRLVSGITLGAWAHTEPGSKGPLPLGADCPDWADCGDRQ